MTVEEQIKKLAEAQAQFVQEVRQGFQVLTELHAESERGMQELRKQMTTLANAMGHLSDITADHEIRIQDLEKGKQTMTVPLRVDWLSENDMLDKAAGLLGYTVVPKTASQKGVELRTALEKRERTPMGMLKKDSPFFVAWEDHLHFTLPQLAELGFK